jgi:hypothetical protein
MRVSNSANGVADTGSSSSGTSTSASSGASAGIGGESSFASVLAKLNAFVDGTPSDRMRAEILAQLGYTEDQLKAMSPAERKKVEDQIAQLMKQDIQKQTEREVQQRLAGSTLAI